MGLVSRGLYAPFLAQLVVIRRCNLSCGYCNEFDETSDPVPFDVLRGRIDKLKELGTFSLEFTGGEPMMNPEINNLIRYARGKSFHKVMMISNAYLMNEKKVRALNDAGLMELQVSVDGVMPNDVTVKVLKPMLPKLRMLAKTAKFKVVLSAVLGATSPDEALTVVETAKEFGFRPRVLVLHDGTGQMHLDEAGQRAFARVKEMLGGRRFREAHDYRERILREGHAPFKCRAGSRYLYVDEFGAVHWCSQTRGVFEKPLAEYTHEDLKTQFYTKKTCADACTIGCVRTQSAYDEWRSQPLDFDGARRLPLVQG
ncbi:MAG TPA: radical SAM protein [Polyangiaceae bacterium]|jgi:MoaA/NifB/PqqE/SkfB family radical SAM enzyme|nr:radical SAM protein [Polyangiaceae bacterium]